VKASHLPLVLLLFAASAQAAGNAIIHAGRLLATAGEPPLDRQSIVISDGRIERIVPGFLSPSGEAADVDVIDLSAYFVMPGLIDAHVHLAFSPEPGSHDGYSRTEADLALAASRHALVTLQSGFTTVVDLGTAGSPGHDNAIYALRDAVARGELAGPRILAAGTPIAASGLDRAGYSPVLAAANDEAPSVCNGADDCRRAVRYQVKRGADIIVFFNTGSLLAEHPVEQTMTVDEMRAIVETAHALGRKVIADGHHAKGIAAALAAGADIIDSAQLYDEDVFSLFGKRAFLQSHIHGVVQAVGGTPETLHDGSWGWLPDALLLRFQQIRLRKFAMVAAWDHGLRNLAYASDAGVYRWGDNAADLVEFVQRGIPAADALRFATANAARMLGLDRDLGSVEAGKIADLIATEGDPLADIEAMRRVVFVMRDGVVFRSARTQASAGAGALRESRP